MKVEDVMQEWVYACQPSDALRVPAQLMWDHDIGAVAVVDDAGKALGMITDRDVLMGLYTSGSSLDTRKVAEVMSAEPYAVQPGQSIQAAETLMKTKQVRRLLVVDGAGALRGIFSLSDLALVAGHQRDVRPEEVVATLASISQPRSGQAAAAP